MVKHIILWQLKDELNESEKEKLKAEIKSGLEALQGKDKGFRAIHVYTEGLSSSNADLMLDCTFSDQDALNRYAVYPAHVKVKDGLIAPNVKTRICFDYEL